MSKKIRRVILIVGLVPVFLLCLYYALAGHGIPYRHYNKLLSRFEQYKTETIECDDDFTGSIRTVRLEMSKEEYRKLREELLNEGWYLQEGDDWKEYGVRTFSKEELEGAECLSHREYTTMFGDVLETYIHLELYVVFDEERVIIECDSVMTILHVPYSRIH